MKSEDAVSQKKPGGLKFNRRTFIKLSALTGVAIGAGQILGPAITHSSDPVPPGAAAPLDEKWINTSCINCPARCAIKVRVAGGKAVKITGNPLSRVSEGKVCPRAYVGLQVLYDQGRVNFPLKRTNAQKGKGVDPKWQPVSWEEALDEIARRLQAIRQKEEPHKLLLFSGLNTRSSEDMIARFAEAYGTPNLVSGDALEAETLKAGNWMADGRYGDVAYDLDNTNYILAFGADILESSRPLARLLRKWGKMRREKPNRTRIVVINPRYSLTAAKSDLWAPINPGTDAALAMALAHVIIRENLYDSAFVSRWTAGFDAYKKLALDEYSPEEVAKITGVDADDIRKMAREFAGTRPAIAIGGREAVDWTNGSYTAYAIACLNALVGSIDVPGGVIYQEGVKFSPMPGIAEDGIAKKGKSQPALDLRKTAKYPLAEVVTNQIPESLLKGEPYPVEMAIGFNSNFNMLSPGMEKWDEALRKIPFYVHIAPFVSEMAFDADIILPATTYLEEWAYDFSPPGSGFAELKLKQPVVPLRGKNRPIPEVIFEIAKKTGGAVANAFAGLGDNAEGFVKYRTASLLSWKEFVETGVWIGNDYEYRKYERLFATPSKKFEFYSGNMKALFAAKKLAAAGDLSFLPHYGAPKFLGEASAFPLVLLPYQPLMVVENGSQNYPWAQEAFLPMCGVGWQVFAEMNTDTAKKLGLKNGGFVWVESASGKIRAKVKFSEGIHPEVVAMATGQGHWSYGKWQTGIGVNPNEITGLDYDSLSGQSAFFNTRVKVYKA
ncbi:MAG: molybdopterin-dependent oxidoreductase [Syntrophales bacterium]|jgi:anaerobic selenocysteine-containing dehydrogenase|nr:molybdopterin-dependent oxidoreductase [Syntrophales bacterium]